MTSAIPHPALSSQYVSIPVIAEGPVNLFIGDSLCKPEPQFQSPVEVKPSSSLLVRKSSCSILPDMLVKPISAATPSTCVSSDALVPVTTTTLSRSSTAALSPYAQPYFTAAAGAPYLYPAGKDKLGRTVVTDENSAMHLDYFEVEPDPINAVLVSPASPDVKDVNKLRSWNLKLPDGQDFVDRVLPPASADVIHDEVFPPEYFLKLHNQVRLGGTYNFAGSRIQLKHSFVNVNKFRLLLEDYDDCGILQLLEFGFPVGLAQEFELKSCTKNHSSSYEFFTFLDQFFTKEVSLRGIAGPLVNSPFPSTMVSPLMTAIKKPNSRRPVFDASFGDLSINNNTPEKEYLGEPYAFTFPTVLDLADLIVKLGPGCLLWKVDLSRWFLQLPVDPGDYDKLGVIWRGAWFFFLSFVWGCRHAGYNAQRVSSAILFILRKIGLKKFHSAYNAMVYIDDFAGAEIGQKAWEAFNDLKLLLVDLGIVESEKKALPPSTTMVFLGVEFDTKQMCMRVGDEKRLEVKSTINDWYRRTVASKQELQSLQGQLMWISKVVRFSRSFVTRIIAEQKSLKGQKQKKTLSHDVKKDLLWWKMFLDVFNGVELLVPQTVSLNVLGDATLSGGGAWNENLAQYWSRKFPFTMQSPDIPIHLKEFYTLIISVKIWGHLWSGKRVALYCDNSAVVDTINYQKPKNTQMQQCLREFLFHVTTLKFEPVMVRIPTHDNFLADFVSRNHSQEDIAKEFSKHGMKKVDEIHIPDEMFFFTADW